MRRRGRVAGVGVRRNFNRRVQALGLTQTQWHANAQLSRNERINQATPADLMEAQPITPARLIDRIKAAGRVERRPSPPLSLALAGFPRPPNARVVRAIRSADARGSHFDAMASSAPWRM